MEFSSKRVAALRRNVEERHIANAMLAVLYISKFA